MSLLCVRGLKAGYGRIAVLKGIIGFERFEEISERVHAATVRHANNADSLWTQRNALQPVTDDALADAGKAADDAVTTCTLAQDALMKARRRWRRRAWIGSHYAQRPSLLRSQHSRRG